MLSLEERDEIRQEVRHELAEIEEEISRHAGTYEYLCLLQGEPTFCHAPVGPVIRRIVRADYVAVA